MKLTEKWMHIALSLAIGLCLRSSIMLQSYSGFSSPPMYGDYEAQRHWMEITNNLPISEWAFSCSFRSGFSRVAGLAIAVIFTNALALLPFLTSLDDLKHVGIRMFPVDRGLFEDKVANFWCISSVLVKWRQVFSTNTLLCVCGLTTLLTSLPACLSLFRNPTMSRLILSETVTALAFFLFSYQVHEKSILLVCVPALCLLPLFPISSASFLLVATLSMWQLFVKDGLCLACISCVVLFYFTTSICFSTDFTGKQRVSLVRFWPLEISLVLYATTFILQVFVPTPSMYPHLFSLFVNALSFAHFLVFFLFWYWQLFFASI